MTSRGRISSFAAGLTALLLVSGLVVPTIVAAAPAAASVVVVPPVSVSNNSRQTILIPVAPGLVPSRISGAITAPQSLNGGSLVGGTVVVTAGGQVVYRGPARAATFDAKLTKPAVSSGSMAVTVKYGVKRLRSNFCASNLQQVGLSINAVSYSGNQTPPTTVAEFLQPGISGVNVVIPAEPNQDQIEAGLAALGAAVYRLGPDLGARLSLGGTDPRITDKPGARVIKIDGDSGQDQTSPTASAAATTSVAVVDGLPTLTISGPASTLTQAANALGGNKLVLANGAQVTNLSQTFRPTVNLNQSFAQLGQSNPSFKGWGSQVLDLTASQSQFGGSVTDMRVRLVGSTTQIPDGAKASINVYWNDALIGSVDLTDSPTIDHEIAVPNSQVESDNNVRVELATLPPGGNCTGQEVTTPIGVSLDSEQSQVRASRGQTQSPGFARFPQSFNGSLPVSFAQGKPTAADIESSALLVAALQRENVPQLAISVVPFVQVDGGVDSTLVIDANEQTSSKLGAPLKLNQLREVHSADLEFKVKVPAPYSAFEAFSSGTRNILMLGGWAPKDVSDSTISTSSLALAEYVYSLPAGWSGLAGDILLAGPGATPQSFNSNAVVPQPPVTQVDRSAFWWMFGVIVAFVCLGAWRYVHVRGRNIGGK